MKIAFLVNEELPQICLYEFSAATLAELKKVLKDQLVDGRGVVWLNALPFVKAFNCSLSLRIAEENYGIQYTGRGIYLCDLKWETYQDWVNALDQLQEEGTFGWLWQQPSGFSLKLVR